MRVMKLVSVESEVRIDIGIDDIRATLGEVFAEARSNPTHQATVLFALSHIGAFLRALTDEQLAQLNGKQQHLCASFLREQADRFEKSEVKVP